MKEKSITNLAKLISVIFHPLAFFLIMPFILIYRETLNPFYALKWQVFSMVFIVIAMVLFLIGKSIGYFSDRDITKREERYVFYTLSWILATLYLVIAIFFKGILFPMSIVSFGIVLGIVLVALGNHFLKISIHTAVACSFIVAIGLLYGAKTFLLISWIIPLVYWARTLLKRHSIYELITGSILGAVVTLLTFLIAKFLYYA